MIDATIPKISNVGLPLRIYISLHMFGNSYWQYKQIWDMREFLEGIIDFGYCFHGPTAPVMCFHISIYRFQNHLLWNSNLFCEFKFLSEISETFMEGNKVNCFLARIYSLCMLSMIALSSHINHHEQFLNRKLHKP